MTTIKINEQGVVTYITEGSNPVELYLEHYKNTSSNIVLSTDEDGMVVTGSISQSINNYTIYGASRFEYVEHSGSQIASGGLNYVPLKINGLYDTYRGGFQGGLTVWNTSSNIFYPNALTASYTIRVTGKIQPIGGNPTFQLDFVLSGSSPDSSSSMHAAGLRHHQSHEQVIRNPLNHVHFKAIFSVFSDPDLCASGGMFYIASDGASLTVISSAILITQH